MLPAPDFKLASTIILTSILTACGGGGGGGSGGSVTNTAPTANAGPFQTINENTTVTLQGSGTDSDGTIAEYTWLQVSGNPISISNSGSASMSFQSPTTSTEIILTFQLIVTDDDGATDTDTVEITVQPVTTTPVVNIPPIADAGVDQTVNEQSTVQFNEQSSDSDGVISSYLWQQTNGTSVTINNATSSNASFIAPATTQHLVLTFQLTVTDNSNASVTDIVNVSVNPIIAIIPDAGTGILNDTGITDCANHIFDDLSCPTVGYPTQDAQTGRDALAIANALVKTGAGNAGFDFTKLDNSGNTLANGANQWSCVKDNTTGLTWEVKTTSGLHASNNSYSGYQASLPVPGYMGLENGGTCSGSDCDTSDYPTQVNATNFCGHSDWRLPTRTELISLLDLSIASNIVSPQPSIDTNFFPNTKADQYWTSSYGARNQDSMWSINFYSGKPTTDYQNHTFHLRLVRND